MPSDPLFWLGCGAVGLGAALVADCRLRRRAPRASAGAIDSPRSGQLRVLTAPELYAKVGARPHLEQIAELAGFDRPNWSRACAPLLDCYAEFVQRLPASESHHHAQPGGLLAHALECAAIALQRRRGLMLPRGAAPEEINARRHRWNYGVLVAALPHDICKPLADLTVTLFGADPHAGKRWEPLAGGMAECGATHYAVGFRAPAERDYGLHPRLPVLLLQRLTPQPALTWLADDADLTRELVAFLSGERDGAIADLVTAADRESVRQNLLLGPRTRFAAARATPVVERLMTA